ncbi:MAG: hypothetical protein KJZ73_11035 [Pseudorhodoplanes sp.]|nr:hypothetical protein [Pseudorhodoplanes sp.]MBW7948061.1 hypothetical protein [Pseudorhodoplanes sp.]MCL4711768.1 hypothetical protein [Pseudorhodoplanes sp.]GIK81009.1 MAG: hypothetical protein BroJett024_21140 [Alphaproteobacteria bacterium]
MNELPFKRFIVNLPQWSVERAAMEATATFAELLKLQLTAAFVEDAEIHRLAAMPGLRELRPLGAGWHPVDPAQWHRAFADAALKAKAAFEAAVRNCSVESSFLTIRGTIRTLVSEHQSEDIVVVMQPKNPAERVSQQYIDLVEEAFSTRAAVMMVPAIMACSSGPVVAIARRIADPSVRIALAVAAAANEGLIVVPTFDGEQQAALLQSLAGGRRVPVRIDEGAGLIPEMPASSFPAAREHERLVIMTRAGEGRDLSMATDIVTRRRVPVLTVPDAD